MTFTVSPDFDPSDGHDPRMTYSRDNPAAPRIMTMSEWAEYTPARDGEAPDDWVEGMEWEFNYRIGEWERPSYKPSWSAGITYRYRLPNQVIEADFLPAKANDAPGEAADWACERCYDLAFPVSAFSRDRKIRHVRAFEGLHNIARYIQATEPPPVDPLESALSDILEYWDNHTGPGDAFAKCLAMLRQRGVTVEGEA